MTLSGLAGAGWTRAGLLRVGVGLLVILLSSAIPIRPRDRATEPANQGASLGAASFSRWQQLELQTRLAFWTGEPSPSMLAQWRELAEVGGSVRIARRALAVHVVADAQAPPDFLSNALGSNARKPGQAEGETTSPQISGSGDENTGKPPPSLDAAELRWWRDLSARKRVTRGTAEVEARLRDLPDWLRNGVAGQLAAVYGDDAAADSARGRLSREAAGSLVPLFAWMSIPALLGVPLLVWALVAGSGRWRWAWVVVFGIAGVVAAVFTGVVASRQTGDPTIGLMSGVMAFGAALVPFAFVGLAARLQRPWLREVPSAPVTDTALAWPVAVECFTAYLALYLGAQAVAGLFAASARSATVGLVVAQVVSGAVAVAFTLWRLRSEGANRREIGVGRSRLPGDVWAGFAGWAMLSPVVALLGVLSHRLLEDRVGLPPNPVLPLMSRPDPLVRGLLVFMAVAVAPVLEEFFFRGVLFSALRRRIGPVRGSLLTGIAFASLHPVVDWLPILGLSTGLCWLRYRRDSLVPAVVAHFFQNGTASLATLILFG